MRFLLFAFCLFLSTVAFAQDRQLGLCWEISGNGLKKSSYLYGTMHTSDERVFNFQEGVMDEFKRCKILALELRFDEINYFSMFSMMLMEGDTSLKDLLTEEEYTTVKSYFVDTLQMGVFGPFSRLQPMFLSMMIPNENLKESGDGTALDLYFDQLAQEQKKKVVGLETAEEQMAAIGSIPYDEQAAQLYESITTPQAEDTITPKMVEMYQRGDVDSLLIITSSNEYSDEFFKAFIVDRNERMAERLLPLIHKKRTFIAVGAAHLGGEVGLIAILRRMGYTVEPYQSK